MCRYGTPGVHGSQKGNHAQGVGSFGSCCGPGHRCGRQCVRTALDHFSRDGPGVQGRARLRHRRSSGPMGLLGPRRPAAPIPTSSAAGPRTRPTSGTPTALARRSSTRPLGRFVGQAAGDNQLMMLYRGDAIGLNPGLTGLTHPIESGEVPQARGEDGVIGAPANQQMVAYWFHDSYAAPNYLNRAGGVLLPDGDSGGHIRTDLRVRSDAGRQRRQPARRRRVAAAVPARARLRPTPLKRWCAGCGSTRPRRSHRRGSRWTGCGSPASNSQAPAALMTVNLNSCASFSSLMITDAGGVGLRRHRLHRQQQQRDIQLRHPPAWQLLAAGVVRQRHLGRFDVRDQHAACRHRDRSRHDRRDPGSDYAALSRGGDRWDFEQATDVASISNISVTGGRV